MRRGEAGLAVATLSAACFGSSGTFASSLLASGWSAGAAVTCRATLAALVLTIPALLALRRHRGAVRRGWPRLTAYGLIAVAGCQLCYFNAIRHVPVAIALLLEYSGVILVVAWLWARGGSRPRLLTVAGCAAAIAGLVLVLDVGGGGHVDAAGIAWGLGAAAGLAVYFILSGDREDAVPPLVMAWAGLAVGAVVLVLAAVVGALPFVAPRTDVTLAHQQMSWLVPVLGLSLIAAVVAYVAGIAGVRLLGSQLAAFVGLLEVLFAVVFAWLLLGESLSGRQIAGAVLVVAGIALVRLDELRSGPAAVVPVPEQEALAVDVQT